MPKTANPQVKIIIRAYIGLLIKFPDHNAYRLLSLRPELIPDDMKNNEGIILNAVMDMRSKIPPIMPTRDSTANWLAINGFADRVPTLDQIIKEVEETDASGAPTYAAFIEAWMQNISGIDVAQKAAAIMQEPSLDYEDKFRRASTEFAKAMPRNSVIESYTEEQLTDLVMLENKLTWEENQLTGDIGWGLPFPAHKSSFARFKPRELTTTIAPTGVGKTTMMMVTAEYNSWQQPIKSNSIIYSLETTALELGQRQISRHLGIPFDAIDAGAVLLTDENWKPKIDAFNLKRRDLSNEKGHLQVEYMPGASIDQITLSMESYAQVSAMMKRRVSFWVDNLQRFDWTQMGMSQSEAFTFIADRLSFVVRKYPNAHLFLVAQEYDGRVFGSTSIERMSQKMLFLNREEPEGGAPEDLPILEPERDSKGHVVKDSSGKPKMVHKRDALGGLRFWHRKGDKFLGKGVIKVEKINSGVGRTIEILFEGALNRMFQDPSQMNRLYEAGILKKPNHT